MCWLWPRFLATIESVLLNTLSPHLFEIIIHLPSILFLDDFAILKCIKLVDAIREAKLSYQLLDLFQFITNDALKEYHSAVFESDLYFWCLLFNLDRFDFFYQTEVDMQHVIGGSLLWICG